MLIIEPDVLEPRPQTATLKARPKTATLKVVGHSVLPDQQLLHDHLRL